ncbi:MAG: hypothetical protein HRU30_16335, partial [Rhodobacteraceae bacterium]|nr:hypothetical protein [Paracoccaceae bacterium]
MLQTILQTIGADAAQNAASLGVSGQGVGGKTGQDGAPANFAAFLAEGGAQGGVAPPVGAQAGLLDGLKSAPGVATAVAAGALDVAAVPVAVGSGVVELARAALTTDSNAAEGQALPQTAPSTGVLDELLQGGAVTAVAVPNEAALGQEGGVLSSAGLDVAIASAATTQTPAAQPATAPVPHITDRPTPTAVPNTAPAQPAAPAGIAPVPVQAGSAAAQIIPNSASNTVAKIDVAAQGMTPSGADASKQLALSQFSGPSPVAPLVSTGKPQPNGQAAPPPLATAPTSPNADSASNVRLGQPELTAPAVSGRLGAIHAQHAVQPANPK